MSEDIKFKEELTIENLLENAGNLKDALIRSDEVVVDATDVRKVDVAALQLLISAKKECRQKGKNLVLRISDEISRLQLLTGIQFDAG